MDQIEERRIKHYSSRHKILLVGEGDFSFSLCLAKAFGSASNMIATSLDSIVDLKINYTRATTNLKKLENFGCTIVHEVHAGTMSQHYLLNQKLFDRIVFNFRHAGFMGREDNLFQILLHKEVVRGFLRSARDMVVENGEIHITHKTGDPYCRWEIEKLAKAVGLRLVDKVPFSIYGYPGYVNKRGAGNNSNETFHVGKCCTFKFAK